MAGIIGHDLQGVVRQPFPLAIEDQNLTPGAASSWRANAQSLAARELIAEFGYLDSVRGWISAARFAGPFELVTVGTPTTSVTRATQAPPATTPFIATSPVPANCRYANAFVSWQSSVSAAEVAAGIAVSINLRASALTGRVGVEALVVDPAGRQATATAPQGQATNGWIFDRGDNGLTLVYPRDFAIASTTRPGAYSVRWRVDGNVVACDSFSVRA
jgi:hypothetical protein